MTDGQSDDDGRNGRAEDDDGQTDDTDEQMTTPTDGWDGRTNHDVDVQTGWTEEYGDKDEADRPGITGRHLKRPNVDPKVAQANADAKAARPSADDGPPLHPPGCSGGDVGLEPARCEFEHPRTAVKKESC